MQCDARRLLHFIWPKPPIAIPIPIGRMGQMPLCMERGAATKSPFIRGHAPQRKGPTADRHYLGICNNGLSLPFPQISQREVVTDVHSGLPTFLATSYIEQVIKLVILPK